MYVRVFTDVYVEGEFDSTDDAMFSFLHYIHEELDKDDLTVEVFDQKTDTWREE